MKNKFLILSCAWCLALLCFFGEAKSQNLTYSSDLPEITVSEFYKVALSPALISKTGNKFSRIRIYDGKNEVPYLIKRYPLSTTTVRLHQLPILNKMRKDSLESIMFGNPDSARLSSVQVTLKRAWTTKRIKVTGSNDGKMWYGVRSEFLMDLTNGTSDNNETDINYTLSLPLTNYKFYKIECNNKDDLAVNILSIGYFSDSQITGRLIQLPQPRVDIIKTREKSPTLFRITFHESYLVNKLVFNISQPHLFLRNARLYTTNPQERTSTKNRSNGFSVEPVSSFILSSKDSVGSIDLNDVYSSQFFVLVENQDNPSLTIQSVQGYYHPYYLKAYLESGKNYILNIGSDSLPSPVYDLSNFDNSADDQVQTLTLKTLAEQQTSVITSPQPFFKSRIWLSVGLIFVALILLYVCIQMIKDMKK